MPLTTLLGQGCRGLPLETGSHLPHLGLIHTLNLAVPMLARTKVWELTIKLSQLNSRVTPDGCPHIFTTSPLVGSSLRHSREIPWQSRCCLSPTRQSRGRKFSPSPPALGVAHAHSTGSLGPGWEPVSLIGTGACPVALQPTEALHLQCGGCKGRRQSYQSPGGVTSPSEPQFSGLQNGRGAEPLVKLQESGSWTRPFLTPGLGPEPSRMG